MNQQPQDPREMYPQRVPLKVVGDNGEALREALDSALARHLEEGTSIEFEVRESSGGTYVAVTAIFVAETREQLMNVYAELRRCEAIRFML